MFIDDGEEEEEMEASSFDLMGYVIVLTQDRRLTGLVSFRSISRTTTRSHLEY
jgi:hypothetical protein